MAANEADLDVTVTDSADPAEAWRFLTYTVTATNNGPGPAFGVTLTDTLPSQADFFSVEPGALCAESGGLVTCDFGDMDVGSEATATIVVMPTQGLTQITNSATVAAVSPVDPEPGNDTAEESTVITP